MGRAKPSEKRGKPNTSPYHVFFQRELKRIKEENPSMPHKDAFKQAGLNWRSSPLNPKNKQAGAQAPSGDQPPAGSTDKASPAPAAPAPALEETVPITEPVSAPLDVPTLPLFTKPISEIEEKPKPILEPPMLSSLEDSSSVVHRPGEMSAVKPIDKPVETPAVKPVERTESASPAPAISSMAAHHVNGTLTAAK
ncbi:hypothetical protein GGH12_000450 [Coemansia sp. RSA 1822]|nr:hypothetical protein LPJ76_000020 [Coemansia sp. RSA 638]KAJ2125606.1 hypothetical protein IW147_000665 [Coemansia sp. RSA 720]KAJ2567116.1 hypothetical protein GGH12_000450 [Coemansia sp. RSA 1822]